LLVFSFSRDYLPCQAKKLHRFIFCNSFVKTSSIMTIFGTHLLQSISYHPCIPCSLYNLRQGTSLSFKSTTGQRTVHVQPSSSFVTRRQTSIIAPNLRLLNILDFSM